MAPSFASKAGIFALFCFTSCINWGRLVVGQKWTVLPDIPGGPSQYHGASLLDGEIYLVGGVGASQQVLSDVRAFNVSSGEWTLKKALPVPIHRPNMVAVAGKIYVLGGLSPAFQATGRSWSYDPRHDEWEELPEMENDEARGASAVGVAGTKIFVAGGFKNFQVGWEQCGRNK